MAARPKLVVGQPVTLAGFFGKALFLRSQPAAELERRLGYRAGRLQQGWWLLFLTRMPRPEEFEFAGYSHLSGGVVQGHLPAPPDPRGAEARLRDGGYDLDGLKRDTIAGTFTLSGAERLAKVIPVAPQEGEPGIPDYPPGSGVPQWKLIQPLPWHVAAFVGPGEEYRGMYA